PSSRWFGPNAFSGAINLITKKDAGDNLSFVLEGGQYGLFSSSLFAGYQTGKIKNQTSVSYRRSDGYRVNTDFKHGAISHQSFLTLGATRLNLQLGYSDKAFGANGFYTAKFPDQYETVKVLSAGLGLRGGTKVQYQGNVRWRRLYDRFELFREGSRWYQKQGDWFVKGSDSAGFRTASGFFPYRGPNFHRTDVVGGEGSIRFRSVLGKTAAGISWQDETIWSNVLGEPAQDTLYSWLDKEAYYDHRKSRQLFNGYLNQLYQKQNFSLSAGVNAFYNGTYGLLFSPGLDVSWFVTGNLKTYFSVNRAIRLPTFTDLYYQGPDHISNPQLKPEKVYGFSAGMQYFMKKVNFSVSAFYRVGYDIIDWVKQDAGSKWESKNLTRLNTFGTSVSLDYTAGETSSHFIQSFRFRYQYLASDKNTGDYVSLYALDYLRHHLSIYLQHTLARRLSAGWTFSIQQRNGFYFDYEHNTRASYETVFLLNAKLRYVLPRFVFYVQASNLLNQHYRDVGSVEMPGIWMLAGVRYRISLKKK
ncbi:MAG TPA: TonB-dependent receptor, partial [Bacteroidetes bacterium]|nr:TonB-dependent receptor [Bacteroidota bacterium]